MLSAIAVRQMSTTDRIAEALRRSRPTLPATAWRTVEAMLKPEALTIMAGTLAAWAGSHLFGIGEIVDVLLRGQAQAVWDRGRPQRYARIHPGDPPPAGHRLNLWRPKRIPGGMLGETNAYSVISVARNQSLSEQRLTLLHELVHRYFSPRTGPLRCLRAELNLSAYSRSVLLRHLEEAMAEGYAQLRVHGLQKALGAYRFPLDNGYLTVAQMMEKGQAIGTMLLGSEVLSVSITRQRVPHMIAEAKPIEIARARASENGCAFAEPLAVAHRQGRLGKAGRFEIETNAGKRGTKARFYCRCGDGKDRG